MTSLLCDVIMSGVLHGDAHFCVCGKTLLFELSFTWICLRTRTSLCGVPGMMMSLACDIIISAKSHITASLCSPTPWELPLIPVSTMIPPDNLACAWVAMWGKAFLIVATKLLNCLPGDIHGFPSVIIFPHQWGDVSVCLQFPQWPLLPAFCSNWFLGFYRCYFSFGFNRFYDALLSHFVFKDYLPQ